MNWQHCNHTVFFPTFSYEQWYQSIRRFWRFGQKNNVVAELVLSDGMEKVLNSLKLKSEKADQMFTKLNSNINESFNVKLRGFDKEIILPNFI